MSIRTEGTTVSMPTGVVKMSPARIPMAVSVNTRVIPPNPPSITSTDWQISHGSPRLSLNQLGVGRPNTAAGTFYRETVVEVALPTWRGQHSVSDSDYDRPADGALYSEKLLSLRTECPVCGEWEEGTGWLVKRETGPLKWYVEVQCTGCRTRGGAWKGDWLPLITDLVRAEEPSGWPEPGRQFGCPDCWPQQAEAARTLLRSLQVEQELVDESHYHVITRRCGACSQQFVSVFTELVDWTDGDDPTYSIILPLTDAEATDLAREGSPPAESQINALGPERRTLHHDAPKGGTPRTFWGTGIRVGPHD